MAVASTETDYTSRRAASVPSAGLRSSPASSEIFTVAPPRAEPAARAKAADPTARVSTTPANAGAARGRTQIGVRASGTTASATAVAHPSQPRAQAPASASDRKSAAVDGRQAAASASANPAPAGPPSPPVPGADADPANAEPGQATAAASAAASKAGDSSGPASATDEAVAKDKTIPEDTPAGMAPTPLLMTIPSGLVVPTPPPSAVGGGAVQQQGQGQIASQTQGQTGAVTAAAAAMLPQRATAPEGSDKASKETGETEAAAAFADGIEIPGGPAPVATPFTAAMATPAAAVETPVAAAQAAPAPVPLGAVPMTIGLRSLAGSNHFEIRLDPKELGRIDVNLDIDKDLGTVKAHLVVDRPETLALLQRDAGSLQQALSQAGLDATKGSINLSLRSDAQSSGQGSDGRRPESQTRGGGAGFSDPADPRLLPDAVPLRALSGLGGIDIRI